MTDEDSKDMADAGSHGAEYDITFSRPLREDEVVHILSQWMSLISSDLTSDRGVIGHIKAFFRCGQGWVKLNLVDLRLDLESEGSIDGKVTGGKMKIMAALIGMNDEDIAWGMDNATSSFKHDFSGLVSIEVSKRNGFIRMEDSG